MKRSTIEWISGSIFWMTLGILVLAGSASGFYTSLVGGIVVGIFSIGLSTLVTGLLTKILLQYEK